MVYCVETPTEERLRGRVMSERDAWEELAISTTLFTLHKSRGLQLTPGDIVSLMIINRIREIRPRHLASMTGFPTGQVTKIVDRLERPGLVGRSAHHTDRRSRWIHILPKGHHLIGEWFDEFGLWVDTLAQHDPSCISRPHVMHFLEMWHRNSFDNE